MEKKRETKQEVIKHSAAIQIQNSITLLQRRSWNVLLANAYDELSDEDEHSIRVQHLMQMLEFHSKNEDYLKEALEALVGCTVQWNVLNKDGEYIWGVTTLLAQAKIERGICTYAYSPEMRRRLHNPSMYARLSLSMQNKFESKHAQALWELSADYLGAAREEGATPTIPLEEFRFLMGIQEGEYPQFMRLNEKVIKPAIKEINRISDFRVTVDYHRKGRKVIALQFKIRRIILLPTPNSGQGKLFPDIEDMPMIVKELKDAGIVARDAWEIYQQGFSYVQESERPANLGENEEAAFAEYICEKIHLLKRLQAAGKVENSTGFLLQAIKRNYANPEFAEARKRQTSEDQKKNRQQRQREIGTLKRRQETLQHARDNAIRQRCKALAEEAPELIAPVVEALLAENATFKKMYNPALAPVENYRHTTAVWSFIDLGLEQHYPDRFADIYAAHDVGLAEVKDRLAALESL
jgi:hypothetical protein